MDENKGEMQEVTQQNTSDILSKAEAIAERIEKANEKAAEILAKNEETLTRITLGGKSSAGKPQEAPKVETAKEYAERVMSGKAVVPK